MKSIIIVIAGALVFSHGALAFAQNVEFVASYDTPGSALGVFVSGQLAYVADSDSGLFILDISDPSNPMPAGSLESGMYDAIDVAVSGNYAYLEEMYCWWGGCFGAIKIIDVSDPTAPDSVGEAAGGGYIEGFSVSGNYAYITWSNMLGNSGLDIVDISEPDSTFLVNSFGTSCPCDNASYHAVFVSANNLYVICCSYFEIWDVSDPYDAGIIGSCWGGCYNDIFVYGNYAYLACAENGLGIIDLSNPSEPFDIGAYETRGPARDVFVAGHYAYVAERNSGIEIFDISEPADPIQAGSFDTPGYARRVYVQDDLIYVADTSSLMILRFNPQTGIEEIGELPRQLALNQNYPNPFNASTRIDFDIPALSDIDVAVYDIMGRRVTTLYQGRLQPGHHSLIWDASDQTSGIYFAKLQAETRSELIRMTLLK